jgi:penicillin G amidase
MNRLAKTALTLLIILGLLVGCSSPAGRFLSYKFSPDLPDESKELTLPGLDGQVTILLDEYGVPHIRAGSNDDLFYALGYMQARDRRFQLEVFRNLALGKMREMVGDVDSSGVMTRLEIFNRMIRLYDDGKRMLQSARPSELSMLNAYATGVNEATKHEPPPLEFQLLQYSPEPWTAFDTGAIMSMIAFGLAKNWEQELIRFEMAWHQIRTGSTADRALRIYKPRYELPPHLIGEKPATDPFASIEPIAPKLTQYLQELAAELPPVSIDQPPLETHASTENPLAGFAQGLSTSNNWAMDGNWTGTGKSALGSDPHMPHMLPSMGYLAHLVCDGCEGGSYDVIGGTFVGLPAIVFGTNGHVAWGTTSNWGDVSDLYIEKAVAGRPDYYATSYGPKMFTVREEIFRIRQKDGSLIEKKRTVRETDHGMIVNDFVDRLPEDFPLVALKRSAEPRRPIGAIVGMYRSKTVTEARSEMNEFSAMVAHWALADADGNIGYTGPMQLPLRHNHLGTFPVPGWLKKYEWDGAIPIDELPFAENPPAGYLGTANNQVVQPESTGYPLNFEGNVPFRWTRISELLAKPENRTHPIETTRALQLDIQDKGLFALRGLYAEALDPLKSDSDNTVADAAKALLSWDGVCVPESTGPTLFETLNAYLIQATLEDEVSAETMHFILTYFNIEPLVFDMLSDPKNPAWDDRRTPESESAVAEIARVFKVAVAALSERYGDSVEKWTWDRSSDFYFQHPFGSQKSLAKYFNRGPFPPLGGPDTVFKSQFKRDQMTYFPIKYGPVLRVNIDLADLNASNMVLPGGQSGHPGSKHYDDQIDLFFAGEGVPMITDFQALREGAEGVLILNPAPKP